MLDPRGSHERPFREAPDQLIQELFRANLKMERVSAVFDANVQKLLERSPVSQCASLALVTRLQKGDLAYRQC